MTKLEAPAALDILGFWTSAGPARWFNRSEDFDSACGIYRALWEEAAAGGLNDWLETAAGTFAYILLTDQIPRNIFRGDPQQFQTDGIALSAARHSAARGYHRLHPMPLQNFYFLPFQHAEDLAAQEEGLDLYRAARDQDAYYWSLVHFDAIRRFGRFPHRNALLGRETTPAEAAYLESGGFGA